MLHNETIYTKIAVDYSLKSLHTFKSFMLRFTGINNRIMDGTIVKSMHINESINDQTINERVDDIVEYFKRSKTNDTLNMNVSEFILNATSLTIISINKLLSDIKLKSTDLCNTFNTWHRTLATIIKCNYYTHTIQIMINNILAYVRANIDSFVIYERMLRLINDIYACDNSESIYADYICQLKRIADTIRMLETTIYSTRSVNVLYIDNELYSRICKCIVRPLGYVYTNYADELMKTKIKRKTMEYLDDIIIGEYVSWIQIYDECSYAEACGETTQMNRENERNNERNNERKIQPIIIQNNVPIIMLYYYNESCIIESKSINLEEYM